MTRFHTAGSFKPPNAGRSFTAACLRWQQVGVSCLCVLSILLVGPQIKYTVPEK